MTMNRKIRRENPAGKAIGITAVLGLLFLGLLAGCADQLGGPSPWPTEETPSAGTGRVLVSIGPQAEEARTLMPAENYNTLSYTLTFVSGDNTVGPIAVTDGSGAAELEAGTWDLQAEGFQGQTKVLVGNVAGIKVEIGQSTSVNVAMKLYTEGESGTLDYSITFPDTVSKALLRVYGWDDWAIKETVVLLDTPESSSGTVSRTGSLTLPAGYYQVILDLFKPNGVLSQSDIVHIYPGMNTSTEYPSFGDTDFAQADIDSSQSTFAAVLSGITTLSAGADVVYILPPGSESLSPASASNTNGNVTVTIDGGGRAVTLDSDGSLFTVGSGVTLKLKNITLQGRRTGTSNTGSLVMVNTSGTLELYDGVLITGNETNSYSGGGVYVNGGTFTMSGGEIANNSASSGGGVYISNSGTFTMNGGKIVGNSASSYGGGVRFDSSGNFTMSGREISDNSASFYGGGVYVSNSGNFTMGGGKIAGNSASSGGGVYCGNEAFTISGGEISGNSASSYGGGVYCDSEAFTISGGEISGNSGNGVFFSGNGTFTMSGGEISGNSDHGVYVSSGNFTMSAGEISGNSASYSGGGVYVSNSGNFTMGGGKISGNSTSDDGGGVWFGGNGNFTMSGGEISGNSASSYGGGVYVSGTFIMNNGEISGNSVSPSGNDYSFGGGGVYVYNSGNFTMSDGKISDNSVSPSGNNNYYYFGGGGVYVQGIFTVSGGEISGNSVSPSGDYSYYSFGGGGVYVYQGTFIKQGGTIYGDTDAVAGNGSATDNTAVSGDGHAVFLSNGSKRRNATAGPTVKLYARFDNYTWTYDGDTVPGIYMDTIINWE
jgi:hypothetical protein